MFSGAAGGIRTLGLIITNEVIFYTALGVFGIGLKIALLSPHRGQARSCKTSLATFPGLSGLAVLMATILLPSAAMSSVGT